MNAVLFVIDNEDVTHDLPRRMYDLVFPVGKDDISTGNQTRETRCMLLPSRA